MNTPNEYNPNFVSNLLSELEAEQRERAIRIRNFRDTMDGAGPRMTEETTLAQLNL